MILGILGIVLFLLGFSVIMYGFYETDDIITFIGIAMHILGFIVLLVFIGVNADTIVSWFKV